MMQQARQGAEKQHHIPESRRSGVQEKVQQQQRPRSNDQEGNCTALRDCLRFHLPLVGITLQHSNLSIANSLTEEMLVRP